MNQLHHFDQHKTTRVVTGHISWAQNITKNSMLGLDVTGKAYLGLLHGRGGGEEEQGRKGKRNGRKE